MTVAAIAKPVTFKLIVFFAATTLAAYVLSTLLVFGIKWRTSENIPIDFCSQVKQETNSKVVRSFQYYKDIWERNLFSVKIDEDEMERTQRLLAKIDQLSLASLNCTLVGTIVYEGKTSWAIIKDNESGKEDKYREGDEIKGAEIVMILRNKVVLNIDGENALLIMGIEKIRAENQISEEKGSATNTDDVETYQVSKEFVTKSVNNVAEIMASVRIKPHFENKRPAGFKISNIRQDSILKSMGFKDGDIIKSVNGKEIRTAEDVMSLYNTLKDSRFFGIGVIRDNQPKTLNFKVR